MWLSQSRHLYTKGADSQFNLRSLPEYRVMSAFLLSRKCGLCLWKPRRWGDVQGGWRKSFLKEWEEECNLSDYAWVWHMAPMWSSFSPFPYNWQASCSTFVLVSPSPQNPLLQRELFGCPVGMNNRVKNPPSALPRSKSCLLQSENHMPVVLSPFHLELLIASSFSLATKW